MPSELERRFLVYAPTSKDAEITCKVLRENRITPVVCDTLQSLICEMHRGVGAVLLAEEVFVRDNTRALAEAIESQPPWSDLPIILITRQGADSPAIADAIDTLGNVILLERPTRINALANAAQARSGALTSVSSPRSDPLAEQAAEALREADRRKDEFLATLAHELRNPLAPLRNSVHILQLTSADDPTTERLCETMERQVNHLVRLVDDLLEVSRITRGRIELRKETVELAAVARNAIETSRPLIDAAGLQLAISLPQDPIMLDGDPIRLAQVFANLLNNAAKYTDRGGQIWFSAKREENDVVITVRDSGIGISAELLPKVFDMFMQVDRSTDRSQGGLGIGLTLVRSLVELHSGSVEAHSAGPGCGSEFRVRLPIQTPSRDAHQGSLPAAAVNVLPSRRILVVDDNVDSAKTLGMLLKYLGGDVVVVHDGPAALNAIDDYRPAVVLLDIGMPGMDGFEVARRIRQLPDTHEIKLIALTGWGQEDDRRRTREAGFDHHLIKPADITALQSILVSLD